MTLKQILERGIDKYAELPQTTGPAPLKPPSSGPANTLATGGGLGGLTPTLPKISPVGAPLSTSPQQTPPLTNNNATGAALKPITPAPPANPQPQPPVAPAPINPAPVTPPAQSLPQPAPAPTAPPLTTAAKPAPVTLPARETAPVTQPRQPAALDIETTTAQLNDKNPEVRAQAVQTVGTSLAATATDEQKNNARAIAAGGEAGAAAAAKGGKTYTDQHVENAIANAPPEVKQDPNSFGAFVSQATGQAQQMWQDGFGFGPMGQAAFMVGVPMALIGLLGGDGLSTILGGLGLGALGIGAGAMGMFGEGTQRNMGRLLGDLGEATGFIAPSARDSGMFAPGSQEATQQRIADAIKQAPRGQGAAVGQKMLDEERAKFDQLRGLHSMNPELAYSYLMGMRGDHAPKTREEAASLFDRLNNTYDETGQKGYLYNQALAQARAQRDAAKSDTWKNVGSTMADWANRTLGTNLDTIPEDDEALARRLQEEYGFEKPAAAVNRLLRKFLITKAARCWAGYEPVPGKEPYSENSCRPVGSKKKKQTGKERHHEKTKQGGAQS